MIISLQDHIAHEVPRKDAAPQLRHHPLARLVGAHRTGNDWPAPTEREQNSGRLAAPDDEWPHIPDLELYAAR